MIEHGSYDLPSSSDDLFREEIEKYRNAALISYGALLTYNEDGRFRHVLDALRTIMGRKLESAS